MIMDVERRERHLRAVKTHTDAAARHEEAALFWAEHNDETRADLERRDAVIERAAAQIERERSELD
jgi:hypothetical protein